MAERVYFFPADTSTIWRHIKSQLQQFKKGLFRHLNGISCLHDPKSKKIGCLWRTFLQIETSNSTSKKILPYCVWAVAFSTPSVQFANNLSRLSNPFCWYQLGLSFQKSSTELRRKEKSFYFLTELDWLQGCPKFRLWDTYYNLLSQS